MAPNLSSQTGILFEGEELISEFSGGNQKPDNRKLKPVWRNIILMGYLHLAAIYGCYLAFTSAKLATTIFAFIMYQLSGLGITAGAHRLWAHKSYKAKWPLRLMLTIFNTIAFQDAVVDWARDHRVHHKFSETDADPHNAKRGFFFSHVGWLLCRKHPEVKQKGKGIDMSDLYADPILKFQKDYYLMVMPIFCFLIPTWVPMYFWGETFKNAFFMNLLRYAWALNVTWLVNSAAHMFGDKPYDKYINPAENLSVALLALGEGWHNYHHTFPWDYKTAELGKYSVNLTCLFIDLMAKIGWAYDLKTVSEDMVRKRVERTGDGSHELWGWGDKDQSEEERTGALILNKQD
ncbi:acyl-CoA Delta-9 desaturase-like [Onthophagus taurus]|uniref:acyl-CoA Delta-9 desaturase-like n=1 Tax=Onthophagus taurus TaxID=166361 RepID=UPI000C1FE9E2|nr:acyl-CoA Delta(11) desaturase-like [Onthophagus taurus]